jgi:hypothetical protein
MASAFGRAKVREYLKVIKYGDLPNIILVKTIDKDYVSAWSDYAKTSSFRDGARRNNPTTLIMYT